MVLTERCQLKERRIPPTLRMHACRFLVENCKCTSPTAATSILLNQSSSTCQSVSREKRVKRQRDWIGMSTIASFAAHKGQRRGRRAIRNSNLEVHYHNHAMPANRANSMSSANIRNNDVTATADGLCSLCSSMQQPLTITPQHKMQQFLSVTLSPHFQLCDAANYT